MKILILIVFFVTLGCAKCDCEIEVRKHIDNGSCGGVTLISYENADVDDCDLDGVVISQEGNTTKTYICD